MAKLKLRSEAQMASPLSAKELKEWRAILGWTQGRAADWLGVKKRSYENWESAHRNPQYPLGVRMRMQLAEQRFVLKGKGAKP